MPTPDVTTFCYEHPDKPATAYVHWIGTRHWNFVCDDCGNVHADKIASTHSVGWGVGRIVDQGVRKGWGRVFTLHSD